MNRHSPFTTLNDHYPSISNPHLHDPNPFPPFNELPFPAVDSLVSLDRVANRDIEWLWPGWIPADRIALFEGDPGEGKSLVLLDLAARLSAGRTFPDGQPAPSTNV